MLQRNKPVLAGSYSSELRFDLAEDLEHRVGRLVLHLHQLVQLSGDFYPVHLQGETPICDPPPALQRRWCWGSGTHSEDSLRFPSGSHVGVVDVFEHHPGLVVFARLIKEKGGVRRAVEQNEAKTEGFQSFLLNFSMKWFPHPPNCNIIT